MIAADGYRSWTPQVVTPPPIIQIIAATYLGDRRQ
jgi:hypothetical protein